VCVCVCVCVTSSNEGKSLKIGLEFKEYRYIFVITSTHVFSAVLNFEFFQIFLNKNSTPFLSRLNRRKSQFILTQRFDLARTHTRTHTCRHVMCESNGPNVLSQHTMYCDH
jgi:hypothetical protein